MARTYYIFYCGSFDMCVAHVCLCVPIRIRLCFVCICVSPEYYVYLLSGLLLTAFGDSLLGHLSVYVSWLGFLFVCTLTASITADTHTYTHTDTPT